MDFYEDCFEYLARKDIQGIRQIFRLYFPLNDDKKVYNFADLEEGLQSEAIHVCEDACEAQIPDIIDIFIETFGELVRPGITGSWTNLCCQHGSIDIIKRIRQLGYELDVINDTSNLLNSFPLRTAVISRDLETVKYILELGADVTLREPELTESALECAYHCNALEIARLLATPETIKMRLRIDPLHGPMPVEYQGNILDLARFENKSQFIELFQQVLDKNLK